ncbi:hypothetical protein [Loktanella fryxellensis]|uniref:hypothetical protein n=1 Tax=Loktanella fryxellensis TaxID=245187 RepID=UPI00115F78C1|nr:hypothetical protein [Loktanella fryxellensis]
MRFVQPTGSRIQPERQVMGHGARPDGAELAQVCLGRSHQRIMLDCDQAERPVRVGGCWSIFCVACGVTTAFLDRRAAEATNIGEGKAVRRCRDYRESVNKPDALPAVRGGDGQVITQSIAV